MLARKTFPNIYEPVDLLPVACFRHQINISYFFPAIAALAAANLASGTLNGEQDT